jgi:hypothetical protein
MARSPGLLRSDRKLNLSLRFAHNNGVASFQLRCWRPICSFGTASRVSTDSPGPWEHGRGRRFSVVMCRRSLHCCCQGGSAHHVSPEGAGRKVWTSLTLRRSQVPSPNPSTLLSLSKSPLTCSRDPLCPPALDARYTTQSPIGLCLPIVLVAALALQRLRSPLSDADRK